jgi:hypothetical protein
VLPNSITETDGERHSFETDAISLFDAAQNRSNSGHCFGGSGGCIDSKFAAAIAGKYGRTGSECGLLGLGGGGGGNSSHPFASEQCGIEVTVRVGSYATATLRG